MGFDAAPLLLYSFLNGYLLAVLSGSPDRADTASGWGCHPLRRLLNSSISIGYCSAL
ncbi:hypothetical protein QX204_02190 [Nocardia sp. PE-7]|uniref:hypothetical protein n=1 Tax=Nocardia sp. PE-7 TaxID=3058426 RepID=UPI00265A0D68|nr:hypothetical protein [Nocardia sp. PE-7]WKG10332.1 hypothetical protein QX204_02190 [Nocardia sp. PE-7]